MENYKEKYGQWAVITGGTSGIGVNIVKEVAKRGMNIVLVARRIEKLEATAKEIKSKFNVEVKIIQADLSEHGEIQKVIDATNDLQIGFFAPVAGVETHGLFPDIDLNDELKVIQLNITSVMVLTHHFTKLMKKRKKGAVLLVASLIGHMPNPYFSNYAGSKAFVLNFGTSLSYELKKYGIDVTVLSPGYTITPMTHDMDAFIDMSKMPFPPQQPEDVAKAGIEALGKQPMVISGKKNNMAVFIGKTFLSTKKAVQMGGKMMDKAMIKKV